MVGVVSSKDALILKDNLRNPPNQHKDTEVSHQALFARINSVHIKEVNLKETISIIEVGSSQGYGSTS